MYWEETRPKCLLALKNVILALGDLPICNSNKEIERYLDMFGNHSELSKRSNSIPNCETKYWDLQNYYVDHMQCISSPIIVRYINIMS